MSGLNNRELLGKGPPGKGQLTGKGVLTRAQPVEGASGLGVPHGPALRANGDKGKQCTWEGS